MPYWHSAEGAKQIWEDSSNRETYGQAELEREAEERRSDAEGAAGGNVARDGREKDGGRTDERRKEVSGQQ